jgi:hypothetical protein
MLSVGWPPSKTLCGRCSQFSALQTRLAKQEQQQVALNIAVTRVENAVCDQPPEGTPHRHRVVADKDDHDNDFIPTTHKLEFPKFDGTGDPLSWLNCCE